MSDEVYKTTRNGKPVEYYLPEDDLQVMLESIFKFHNDFENLDIDAFDYGRDEESLSSAEYLRGIADSIPNGDRLKKIAVTIDVIKMLYSNVQIRWMPEETNQ